jgi:hypothetical protein
LSHDVEASYAAAEVAATLLATPSDCFAVPPLPARLSVSAVREGRNEWPHADGVIELAVTDPAGPRQFSVALEFKRPNEGLHGILTALGQAHAYLRKGYTGAVIVVPESYPGLQDSGSYLKEVIELTSKAEAIGVYAYRPPDMSKVAPFSGCLHLHKQFKIDAPPAIITPRRLAPRTETQWAHVREGSTEPDAFFRYLQSVKLLSGGEIDVHRPRIPSDLINAVNRAHAHADPEKYLSYSTGDALKDRAWRNFWFKYVLRDDALPGWRKANGVFSVNNTPTKLERSDAAGKKAFFAGKSNSPKNKLVAQLNASSISEAKAADGLVKNYRSRAHSYREDIDSGCEHLGLVDSEGRLTDDGYRFVDVCERYGNPNAGLPRALFLKALLGEGGLGPFLHYIYRLSEETFRATPLAFTKGRGGNLKFDQKAYLQWIEGEMANRLHVIRKVSLRGGVERKPFQAELALLRNLNIVERGFRVGVGLVINWPEFQEALGYDSQSIIYG